MAHCPVRHPFGASITYVILFKIVPGDFVEPSEHVTVHLISSQALIRAVTLGIRASIVCSRHNLPPPSMESFRDTCPSLDVVPALRPLGRPAAVPNGSRQFSQSALAPLQGLNF